RARSSPTQKGMRISSAEQSRTCISRRLPTKSESAASVVTTLPSNRWPHSSVRLAKKASCGVGAAGWEAQADSAMAPARAAADRAAGRVKLGVFMARAYLVRRLAQGGIETVDFGPRVSMFRASYFKRLSPSQR